MEKATGLEARADSRFHFMQSLNAAESVEKLSWSQGCLREQLILAEFPSYDHALCWVRWCVNKAALATSTVIWCIWQEDSISESG